MHSSALAGSFHFSKKPSFHPVKTGNLIFSAPSLGPVPLLVWGCQNRHKICQCVSFQHNRTPLHFYGSRTTQNLKQHLHPFFCRHYSQNKCAHPGKCPVYKNHFIRRRNTILNRHGVVGLKALPQFVNDQIRNCGDFLPKTHETADSTGMTNFAEILLKHTTNKNVARKQGFHDTHYTALGRPLHAQTRMKYFQSQVLAHVGCGNVFMLWLRSCAIPSQGTVSFLPTGSPVAGFFNRSIEQRTEIRTIRFLGREHF